MVTSRHLSLDWSFPSPMEDTTTVIIEEERKVTLHDETMREEN